MPEKRIVDPEKFIPILESALESGGSVSLTVTGGSMLPFLAPKRDAVVLVSADRGLKKGDIVFFRRKNGDCVLHRIMKIKNGVYFTAGDAQNALERLAEPRQILAVADTAVRKGRRISRTSLVWRFFSRVWPLTFKRRPQIIKLISRCGRLKNKQ